MTADPEPRPQENPVTAVDRDAAADALAFTLATLRGDGRGRVAIARNCRPADLVDSLAAMVCVLLATAGADPAEALAGMLVDLASRPEDWPAA